MLQVFVHSSLQCGSAGEDTEDAKCTDSDGHTHESRSFHLAKPGPTSQTFSPFRRSKTLACNGV